MSWFLNTQTFRPVSWRCATLHWLGCQSARMAVQRVAHGGTRTGGITTSVRQEHTSGLATGTGRGIQVRKVLLRVLAQPSGRLLASFLDGVAGVALLHRAVPPRGHHRPPRPVFRLRFVPGCVVSLNGPDRVCPSAPRCFFHGASLFHPGCLYLKLREYSDDLRLAASSRIGNL